MSSKWLAGFALVVLSVAPALAQGWPNFGGQDNSNSASAGGVSISAKNVNSLKPRWVFTTGGDVSARASVSGGVAYFPDWAGNIYAVNANTGALIWSHQLSDYGLAPGTVSRNTPTFGNGVIYVGTQFNPADIGSSGWLLAIDANKGTLRWKTRPDTSNGFPVITASPSVANGMIFIGMTSNEEFAAADPSYPCCSASGSIVALKESDGSKVWQTFTVPAGYSGASVWGSSPVVDVARKTVFVGTGDNFSHPTAPAYVSCIASGGTEATCLSPNDYVDSVVALDMKTGAVKWATRLVAWNQNPYGVTDGSDDWNVACFTTFSNCPPNIPSVNPIEPTGPDYDFGSAPNEITFKDGKGKPRTIIGAGQKSGIYYALDPDSGAVLWQTQVGPGSSLGGIEWGSASDGDRIYVAIANLYGIPYAGGNAGSWAALDPSTGTILWRTADPNQAMDLGPLAVANGVLYAPSMAQGPTASTMFGLDAATGNILWDFAAGGSVVAGATPVNNNLYWGSGYSHLGALGTGNNKFFGFTPNGK